MHGKRSALPFGRPSSHLQIRRFQCGHPDPFRSVRGLGFVTARCSHPSGELQGRSSVWLPAWLPSVGHHHVLVLVTTIGPLPSAVTAPAPPGHLPEPDCCRTLRQTALSKGRRSRLRSRSEASWGHASTVGSATANLSGRYGCVCISASRPPRAMHMAVMQSRLRVEGRTRTLSGPSPDLSPTRTLAPFPCRPKAQGNLLAVGHPAAPLLVLGRPRQRPGAANRRIRPRQLLSGGQQGSVLRYFPALSKRIQSSGHGAAAELCLAVIAFFRMASDPLRMSFKGWCHTSNTHWSGTTLWRANIARLSNTPRVR
jgi:hypothetical protein